MMALRLQTAHVQQSCTVAWLHAGRKLKGFSNNGGGGFGAAAAGSASGGNGGGGGGNDDHGGDNNRGDHCRGTPHERCFATARHGSRQRLYSAAVCTLHGRAAC